MDSKMKNKGCCNLDTWNMFEQRHEDSVNIYCQNKATEVVIGLDNEPLRGKVCPYHKAQMEHLIHGVNHCVSLYTGFKGEIDG